ncbi:hypothetical protein BDK51DRAFT_51309, partial [Blyttiomyces helicus]
LNLLWYIQRDDGIRNWQGFLHGDKDLYRFTFRATKTPVYWVPHLVTEGGFMLPDDQPNPRFCGVCMVQHAPLGSLLVAHCNFIKRVNKRRFSATNPPFSIIKRYKPLPAESLLVGPEPETRAMWPPNRGAHAGFWTVDGDWCVDIFGDKRSGMERQTEVESLERVDPTFAEQLYWLLIHEKAE